MTGVHQRLDVSENHFENAQPTTHGHDADGILRKAEVPELSENVRTPATTVASASKTAVRGLPGSPDRNHNEKG